MCKKDQDFSQSLELDSPPLLANIGNATACHTEKWKTKRKGKEGGCYSNWQAGGGGANSNNNKYA